ncbi:MAG: hypothetical protein R3F19_03740 [Verrucomicrobiales bacterium]
MKLRSAILLLFLIFEWRYDYDLRAADFRARPGGFATDVRPENCIKVKRTGSFN